MEWNQSFIDGGVLKQDVDKIIYKRKEYYIDIKVGKYKNEVNKAFNELRQLDSYKDDEEIEATINSRGLLSGQEAKWVRGSHPALHYRGNALKRHKVWFQREGKGFYAYKYTGWQKKVLNATFRIKNGRFPKTCNLVRAMKRDCNQNHWIATVYENGEDYIGMHSDKMKTWVKGSKFQVIKWGYPRIFLICLKDHEDVDKCTVLFRKILPAGTSIIVDSETNEITRHGVPVMDDCDKISGSIVGRDIETFISFEESKKMVEQAKRDALKRKLKKEEKSNKKVKL